MAGSSVTLGGAVPRRSSRERYRSGAVKLGCKQKGSGRNAADGRVTKKPTCCWQENQVSEFSKIIYGYKALHGRLPEATDTEFWAWCCAHFKGCFEVRQLRDKMRRLQLRYKQISSGHAKSFKVSERVTFDIWTSIMLSSISASPPNIPAATPPPHPPTSSSGINPLSTPPHRAPPTSLPAAAPCMSSLSSGSSPPPIPVVAEDDIAIEHQRQAAPEKHLDNNAATGLPRCRQPAHAAHQEEKTPVMAEEIGIDDQRQVAPEKNSDDNATAIPPKSRQPAHAHQEEDTPGACRDARHYNAKDEEKGGVRVEAELKSKSTCSVKNSMGQEGKFGRTFLYNATFANLSSTTKALAKATLTLAKVLQSNGPPE